MNKLELITTIISIVLTIATTGLGIFLSKYNSKQRSFMNHI